MITITSSVTTSGIVSALLAVNLLVQLGPGGSAGTILQTPPGRHFGVPLGFSGSNCFLRRGGFVGILFFLGF